MNCSSWNAWICQRRLTAKAFAKYVVIDQEQKQSFCHTYPLQKPALRVHWLVPKQPNSSRNRAQHAFPAQRPESLTLRTDTLKKQSFCHTYPLQKPALRVHWLVPKQPNSSRNRAQHAFPAQRPESLTLRADALKKQSFCHTYALQKPALRVHWLVPKRPNSSRIRAQHAFPAQRPESLTSRTDALKKQSFCHTYLLQKPALRVHWLVPKQPKSSRNRAQHAFPARRPESLTSHTDTLKKTKLMPHLTSFESPLAGSETAEQQQDSCPTCLPSTAPRISDVAYWRPKKTKLLPHLPIAETSFESPLAGCETAEQQQESCPTCLPSTAPRISNVAYWRPKKTKLMPHLPIAKNHLWESIELAGSETAEQQQESCPTCLPSTAPRISNVAYWRPKKTKLLPHLPIAETSFESPLAGCKTAEQQQESCPTCLPSTAPRISNVAYWRPKKTKLMPHLPIAKTSFESPLAGSETAEKQQESCPTCLPSTAPRISNVAYWRPKKTKLLPHLPIAETSFESPLAGSETAEQQQESCPTCLPSTAPRISNVAYWHPKKTKLMPHLPIAETSFESPLAGCETAEQQQESCPTCLPSTAPRISNVACWRPQKTKLLPHLPIAETSFDSPWAGSETAEKQQDSCPTCLPSTAPRISNVAYWRPKKTKLMPHLPIAKTSFESPLAGSETAEQQQESCPTCLPSTAPRISNVAYWRPIFQSFCHTYLLQKPALAVHWLVAKQPNSSRNRAQHAFPAQRPESLTSRTDALKKQSFCHTYPLQKPALRVLWLVAKQPNGSRNRAQHAFPAQRPESLTSRTDALKKQSLCHTYLLQKPALRVHWLVPKQPKSSRNRAQHAFPAQRSESLTSRTDTLKKQSFCHTYSLQKPALRVHWLVPKQPNSSRNRARHAFPAQRPESLTLRTDTLKKQSLCHTYPLQKPALRVHWLVAKQPNSSRNRAQHAFPAQRPESLTLRADALKKQSFCHTYPLQKPALTVLGLVPKRPKSSRIRAQHAFPAQRPESLTLRTDALKKQSLCHTYLLQKPALRVHWLVPKQPNSSRNRAQHAFPAQRPESLTSRTDALFFKASATPTYCKNQLWRSIGWLRNSRTAAGIVPNMPSQHSAPNL